MTDDDDWPIIRRYREPPNPHEVRFEPELEHPPLTLPSRRQSEDPVVYERRLHAEYLNM